MGTTSAKSKGSTGVLAKACGLVVILALVVAPSCAPLCAARICSQPSAWITAERPCHLAGLLRGGESQFRAVQNCGAFESPAAVLNSSVKNDALRAGSAAAADATFDILPRELFVPRVQNNERNVAVLLSPHFSASLMSSQILRI
jgi:hypothetical protein